MKVPAIITEIVRKLTAWAWTSEIAFRESAVWLKEIHGTPGKMELTIEQKPELAEWFATVIGSLVIQSPNYTECQLHTNARWKGTVEWVTVTIQKEGRPTPHEKRVEAEKRVKKLEEALRGLHEDAKELAAKDKGGFADLVEQICDRALQEATHSAEEVLTDLMKGDS